MSNSFTEEGISRFKTFIVLSGPSGVGKSTLIKEALSFFGPEKLGSTVSYTTRNRRNGEAEGKDYHFVSHDEFEKLKDNDFFAEWACVYNHYYGTPLNQIYKFWNENKVIIKDLDLLGAELIKKRFPSTLGVFVLPPSLDTLIERIRKRQHNNGGEKEDMVIRRKQACKEIQQASDFDYQLVNKNFSETFEKLKKIIETYIKSP